MEKETTTVLDPAWKKINVAPLTHIGFSPSQLAQLASLGIITPDVVQESIYHFAYGLEHNAKVKVYPQPLNVLMGVLRKGQAWIESGYESPKTRAIWHC